MLKKGDKVVMHTCIEASDKKNYGKVWICNSDEWNYGEGIYKQNLIWLEGYTSSFNTKFLQKINC